MIGGEKSMITENNTFNNIIINVFFRYSTIRDSVSIASPSNISFHTSYIFLSSNTIYFR